MGSGAAHRHSRARELGTAAREAEKIHRQSLEFVEERLGEASGRFPPVGAALIGLGRLLYEWGDFAEAQKSTRDGIQLIEKVGGLGISKDGYLTLALIENTHGNTVRAIELVEKSEKIARGVKRPEVLARLTPHKVNYVYVSNPRQEANHYVDTSETIDLKIEALRQHKSQLGEWDPEEPIKKWNADTGKVVGFAYAERFLRITLKEPETEAEAGSANE